MTTFHHVPVLLHETIELLNCRPGNIIVDGTLGGGGHANEIIRRIVPGGLLVGIDQDPKALKAAREKLAAYGDSLITIHDNFANLEEIMQRCSLSYMDGMVIDLGVSSYQLDQGSRGFSYQTEARLDMRMNPEQSLSAYEVVNEYEENKLACIIAEYGEERWAKRIAEFIVKRRPIHTTSQLTDAIKAAIPASARRKGPHPAKRTFQAIRIEVNDELGNLKKVLNQAIALLKPGGRLCVITFHSLEDRIVKTVFRNMENPCTCPPRAPICTCGKKPLVKVITRKPIVPSDEEIKQNPRARSAKLRACQKL
jgi:16S rRNA (cytosine1402-N4)-methyltransferase